MSKDITGMRFGKLTAIKLDHKEQIYCNGIKRGFREYWLFKCDCGNEKVIQKNTVVRGESQSCGCHKKEVCGDVHRKHGLRQTSLYSTWKGIKNRCYNRNANNYKNYGAKNIKMCPEWKDDFTSFYNWAINNGYKDNESQDYNEKYTIERIDVNKDYSPENCKWIKFKEQVVNKSNHAYLTYNGQTKYYAEWEKEFNLPKGTIRGRLRNNWSIEKTLLTPVKHKNSI